MEKDRTFRITDDGDEKDIRDIHEKLKVFNLHHREASKNVPIGIFYEDQDGKKLAGLTGETFGNWLCIHYLFVEEHLRKDDYPYTGKRHYYTKQL
ncbi:MAG: hypothetical protein K5776_02100 [Lachnospiraceae bacterium]|nr:hypothetical protein [Lachnospiraceae bacterium]